jgi:hypothetical protein
MRVLRIVLLCLLAVGVAIAQTAPTGLTQCKQPAPVQIKPIGNPIWMPVDFHVFTAAIGTAQDGYAEFAQNTVNLMYPLRHKWCTELGVGPGDPHQPPYKQEMEAGLDIMNFKDSRVFRVSDFSSPNGVWATWMTVPKPGTTGSSPDFKSGPIIPNTLFPIHVAGETYRNNQLWNPWLASFDVPALTGQLSCPFSVDGHSHFPVFIADNSDFGPGGPISGHYEFRVTMVDATGNGWSITVHFTVQQSMGT